MQTKTRQIKGRQTTVRKTDFHSAVRSFVGYLEGSGKAEHTIKNYQLDISAFHRFISDEYAKGDKGRILKVSEIDHTDLKRYSSHLKVKGLKNNTRRRKILTVSKFLSYLAKRKKVGQELAHKVATPHKIERIPFTVPVLELLQNIQKLPKESLLEFRNRCLFWTLLETGCLVSEIAELHFDQWVVNTAGRATVEFGGKFQRTVPVSNELFAEIQALKSKTKEATWIFFGFNKFGSLGSPISSRGVEMLVKHYATRLGFPELTPRTFRHSAILKWFQDGLPQTEIQSRLGLKTTYAFRSYEPLLTSDGQTKSRTETTSTAETTPTES